MSTHQRESSYKRLPPPPAPVRLNAQLLATIRTRITRGEDPQIFFRELGIDPGGPQGRRYIEAATT